MPKTKKVRVARKKRTTKKKTVRRKKNTMPSGAYSMRMPKGLPQRLFTKLVYCDNRIFTIDTSTGPLNGLYSYKYSSSLFDPDKVNSGHQPLLYSQYTSLYEKYRVYGIGYRIEIINTNTNQLMPFIFWVGTTLPDIINPATYDQWTNAEEQKDTRVIKVPPASSGPTVVKGYIDIAKTIGISRTELRADDKYTALWSADPQTMVYLHIYGSSFNQSTSNMANLRIRLVYYCEFHNMRTVFPSIAPGEVFVPPNPEAVQAPIGQ